MRPEDEVVTAFRDGQVTLRSLRRAEGYTFSNKEIGYQGVRAGDLVVHQMDAFAGAIGVSEADGKSTPVYTVLQPLMPDAIDSRFYMYLLRHLAKSDYILSLAKGIRERSTDFRWAELAELELPAPPRKVQQYIVEYLGSETTRIDTLIDRKQRLIDLLLEKRTALIAHAVTQGLDLNVEMRDSGVSWLGSMPAGWSLQPLKRLIANCQNGCWGEEPGTAEVDAYCVRAADFDRYAMRVESAKLPLRGLTRHELDRNRLRSGDLVIEKSGGGDDQPVGKVVHCNLNDVDAVCSNFQARIKTVPGVNSRYVTYLFEALYSVGVNRRYIKQTTGLQNLDVKAYFTELVPLPGIAEQATIVEHLAADLATLDGAVFGTRRSIDLLREYRTAIISAAVTGQIDIPAPETTEEVA